MAAAEAGGRIGPWEEPEMPDSIMKQVGVLKLKLSQRMKFEFEILFQIHVIMVRRWQKCVVTLLPTR